MERTELLKDLFAPVFEANNVRLYELNWISGKENTLEVAIMKTDGSMDLDTCAAVSEQLSAVLDEADPISEEYTLEVCSPGAEREIKDPEELDQLAGKYIYVRLREPFKKMVEFTGEVKDVDGNLIHLEYRDKAARRIAEFTKENIEFIRYAVRF